MKNIRPILLFLLVLLIAGSTFAQRKFEGRVVEVVDGKTIVIDSSSGKVTAELQYIETPEPENPLSKTVRGHLENLVLGKSVEFRLQGFSFVKMTGQIHLGDVDIAQQMLRDGAAWHLPPARSSQDKQASDIYESTQQQAKSEKRGIWARDDLRPAALLREESNAAARRQEQYSHEHPETNAPFNQSAFAETNRREAIKRPGKWGDVNPNMPNIGAIYNGYNAETKTGFVTTGFAEVQDIGKEDPSHKVQIDVTYVYHEDERKGRTGTFVVTLDSISKDWYFLKSNDLILTIGDKDTVVGKPRRKTAQDGDLVRERLTYEVSRDTVDKMYNGGNAAIRVGKYVIWMTQGAQLLLYNMLEATK